MPDVFGVTADVYENPPITILDLAVVEYTIRLGRYGPVEDAYWHVSIVPVTPVSTWPPGHLEVTRQWFETDQNGASTLHYIVDNHTPSPIKRTFCTFKRKLVRIPAR
jgi:hypothetical protein